MRIKSFKGKNYFDIKELDISFADKENIIFIVETYDGESNEIPFGDPLLDLMNFLFFDGSYFYAENLGNKNTLIECEVKKDGVEYMLEGQGNCKRTVEENQVCVSKALDFFVVCPKNLMYGKPGSRLELRNIELAKYPKEYFYPDELKRFVWFNKNTYADSPTDLIDVGEFSWLKLMAKLNNQRVDLEQELQKLIDHFREIKIDEQISIGMDKEKEYVLIFEDCIVPEEMLSEEEKLLINFYGWINNLNILKEICEIAGEDGNLPVFIDITSSNIFEKNTEVLIKKLRETDRQVFIISQKRDEELEKLCDKVIEIEF